ncbi:uncharacterized protein LOC143238077 [Tachypleus tridentatus]|uniref:uncharacterized protein LOC143238077 n=1 Tax=Tachypleus tridentatus TaxID=6853 RepID=UPI003FCF23A4
MPPDATIFRCFDTLWARYSLQVCACVSVLILAVIAHKEEIMVPKRNIESTHYDKPGVLPEASSTLQPSFYSTVFSTRNEQSNDVTRFIPSERYWYSSSDYSPPLALDLSPTSNGQSWNVELVHRPSSQVSVKHKIDIERFKNSIHIRPTTVYNIPFSDTEMLERSDTFEIETKLFESSVYIRPTPVLYVSSSDKEQSAVFKEIVLKTSHEISSSFSTDKVNFLKGPSFKSLTIIETKQKYLTKDAQKTPAMETFTEHKSVSDTSLELERITRNASSSENTQYNIQKKHSLGASVIFKDSTVSIPLDGSVIFKDSTASIPLDGSVIFKDSTASIPLDGSVIFKDSTASIPLDGSVIFKDSTASIPLDGSVIFKDSTASIFLDGSVIFKDSTTSIPLNRPTIPFKDFTSSVCLDGLITSFEDFTTSLPQLSRIEELKSKIFTETASLPTAVLFTGSLLNNKEINHPSFLSKQTLHVHLSPAKTFHPFHFTEPISAVFYDIEPSLVYEPVVKLNSVTLKGTSYDKNHAEEFPNKINKEDNSIKSPSTDLNDSKETKGTLKNVSSVFKNEHLPVQPRNVSIVSTNESKETTLKPAGPTKMSPQDFIPSIFVYIILTLGMEWPDFCAEKEFLRKEIAESISKRGELVQVKQIVFMTSGEHCSSELKKEEKLSVLKNSGDKFIDVNLFLMDEKGNYDFNLTETCGALMQLEAGDTESIIGNRKVYRVQVEFKTKEERDQVYPSTDNRRNDSPRTTMIIIVVASVASVCALLIAILLVIMKQRLRKASGCETSHQEAYNLDYFPTAANVRRKKSRFSMRSFLNQAYEDPDVPSHPLDYTGLINFTCNGQAIEEEFQIIPTNMPRMDQVPTGAEVKNRYANVIPEPKTRVPLTLIKGEPNSNYINANFVRGYGGQEKFYIACQAPLPETVGDFWRMVWEQQSKVIVMLTQWEEDDVPRCAPYFSENIVDCHRVFGDFQVSLQKKDIQENYTISTLRLYNLEKNLFREITHLYYTTWPAHGVPDDVNKLLKFILEARRYMNLSTGPVIFHCSAGTSRTGIVLALDMCMREFEETRTVDLLRCVYRLRQDRGGVVQTIQHYSFVYEALTDYACRLVNQSHRPSIMPVV